MVTVVLNFRRLTAFKLKEMAEAAEFDDRSDYAGTAGATPINDATNL